MTSYRFALNMLLAGMVGFAFGFFQAGNGMPPNPTEGAGILLAIAFAFALVDVITTAIVEAWKIPWNYPETEREKRQRRRGDARQAEVAENTK